MSKRYNVSKQVPSWAPAVIQCIARTLNLHCCSTRQSQTCSAVCYLQVGPSVQKYLPDDLNPKIKEQLDSEMGGAQGAGPLPGPPPAAASSSAAPAPAKKQAANANKKKSNADKAAKQAVHQAPAQRGQHQAEDHALAGMHNTRSMTCILSAHADLLKEPFLAGIVG